MTRPTARRAAATVRARRRGPGATDPWLACPAFLISMMVERNLHGMEILLFDPGRSMLTDRTDLEHLAVIAGLARDHELAAAIEPRHDRHHGHDRSAARPIQRGRDARLLAELDQVAGGRKRQLEAAIFTALER